jgi:predicted deacylase
VTGSEAEGPTPRRRGRPRLPRNEPIQIGGVTVNPGGRRTLALPMARLPTGTHITLAVEVVCGLRPGPRLWLDAAIHGDELNGIEIIREVLRTVHPRTLRGTIVAVPIVNVFGFVNESRYLPDRRDLNRSFPGSPRGSLAAQLAHLFLTEVVDRCQYGIDFHTGSDHRTNLPQLRVDLSMPEVERLSKAFGAPVTVHAQYRDGSLRAACTKRDIPLLVYEGGEAHRFNEQVIRAGVEGTMRVLAELDMCPGDGLPSARPTVVVHNTAWERASRGGIVRIDVHPGQQVERGEVLGVIADALGTRPARVRASRDGIVVGYTRNPLVNRGEALVHIADVGEGAHGGPARPPS